MASTTTTDLFDRIAFLHYAPGDGLGLVRIGKIEEGWMDVEVHHRQTMVVKYDASYICAPVDDLAATAYAALGGPPIVRLRKAPWEHCTPVFHDCEGQTYCWIFRPWTTGTSLTLWEDVYDYMLEEWDFAAFDEPTYLERYVEYPPEDMRSPAPGNAHSQG